MQLKRVLKWTAGVVSLALVAAVLFAYWSSDNECDEGNRVPAANPMKAVVYCDYGSPAVLEIEDVEKPVATDSQVVVRVRAAAINPLDWHYMRGTPYIGRIAMGLRKPKDIRIGVDFAGTVESVGKAVTQFKAGDEVFGGRTGALGQYVAVNADRAVVLKPVNLSFEQAAAVPVAAVTALEALRDQGKVQPGQRVLINGASGGVGTFAVQIAKAFGAHVTGVCSTRNVELVRGIGADQVVDYTKEDFTTSGQRYDVIIDNVGNHSLSDLRRVLKPEGKYVMVGGPSGGWIDPLPRLLRMFAYSWFVKEDLRFFIADLNQQNLLVLRDLLVSGKVTPVIDRRYSLGDIREAIAYLETGRARGKVVVTID